MFTTIQVFNWRCKILYFAFNALGPLIPHKYTHTSNEMSWNYARHVQQELLDFRIDAFKCTERHGIRSCPQKRVDVMMENVEVLRVIPLHIQNSICIIRSFVCNVYVRAGVTYSSCFYFILFFFICVKQTLNGFYVPACQFVVKFIYFRMEIN